MQKYQAFAALIAVAASLALLPPSVAQEQRFGDAPQTPMTEADPEIAALDRRVADLRKAGKNEEALSAARQALALTLERRGRDGLPAARAFTVVAELYFQLHKYIEAEPLFQRALEITQTVGADQTEIAAARENLAKVRRAQLEAAKASRPSGRDLSAERSEEAAPRARGLARSITRAPAEAAPTEWDVVPIFYGTDRKREPNPKRVSYNEQRAHRLEVGRALVTVPKNHQIPEIERPWALHIPYFDITLYEQTEDPKEHFTLQEVKALSKPEFLALVGERLATSTRFKDHAFVFVHGYNTSFDFALYRAAQITNDLHFDGAPFVYSWPSGGAVTTYGWDRESAEGARDYLRQFLDMVVKDTGAKSISLIAHSMGNIALMDVLRDMNAARPQGVVISQIIFAAPDVSVDDFAKLAKSINGLASGATLYASSNDRALQISRGIWRSYRAGDVPPTGPMLAEGVDTIDVTAASTDVFDLNHSGYAQNNDLLNDVGALIEKGIHPPEARSKRIHAVTSPKGIYWKYVP